MSTTAIGADRPAPDFTLPATGGRTIHLADFRGKQVVVLYFYPKDDTPGCTTEACSFRDLSGTFAEAGAAILGVSTDDITSHEAFAAKHHLPFPLLADTDAAVSTAYGVYGPKNTYGKETIGITRSTFVIDREGIVRKVYRRMNVEEHAGEVLEAVRALS